MEIAVIDSGINPWHSHVEGWVEGVGLRVGRSGRIVESRDYRDEIGHGTAIAGLIREKAPQARLYAIKIFHDELQAPTGLLLASLRRAIRRGSKVIHLSLGTERLQDRPPLEQLCLEAYRKRIVIVASARSPKDDVAPASLRTVIGVCAHRNGPRDALVYHPGMPVEFCAYGRPRPLPGLPEERNFFGASFAAARVTALAARLLERHPRAGVGWVRERLREQATTGGWES